MQHYCTDVHPCTVGLTGDVEVSSLAPALHRPCTDTCNLHVVIGLTDAQSYVELVQFYISMSSFFISYFEFFLHFLFW